MKTGLRIEGGSHLTIAENTLTGVECYGSYSRIASNNFIAGSGIDAGGSYSVVYDNTVTDVSRGSGISSHGNGNTIANNTVTKSYYGVINGEGSNNFVYSNRITHNVYGLMITGGNSNTFYANDLVNNSCGAEIGYLEPPATNCTLYHNNFIGIRHGLVARHSAVGPPHVKDGSLETYLHFVGNGGFQIPGGDQFDEGRTMLSDEVIAFLSSFFGVLPVLGLFCQPVDL